MKESRHPGFRLDSFNLINFIFSYWKLFLITGMAAAVISIAVSLTITPMYLSTVTLYPSSNITAGAPGLFDGESTAIGFGDEEATEKVLQILMSDRISDYITDKYNLMEHWGIEPDSRYRYSQLAAKMNKQISFRKTRYMSVEVNVLDIDPELAASMANDIAAMIDSTFNGMLQTAGRKYLSVIESQYNLQAKLVMAYEDSLLQGNLWRQVENGYNPSLARRESLRVPAGASPYSPDYLRFSISHEMALEELGMLRKKYTEATMAATEQLPYTLVINSARVAERKAFPDRSAIVIISTLSALLFMLVVLIVIDGIRMVPGPTE